MPEHHQNGLITPETKIKFTIKEAVAYLLLIATILGSYFNASYRIQRLEEKVTESATAYVSRIEMKLTVEPLQDRIQKLEQEKYLNDIERYGAAQPTKRRGR